jgi:hypothetical protein
MNFKLPETAKMCAQKTRHALNDTMISPTSAPFDFTFGSVQVETMV